MVGTRLAGRSKRLPLTGEKQTIPAPREVDAVTRLKELEEENRRLKQVVAEQGLDTSVPREVARGNY